MSTVGMRAGRSWSCLKMPHMDGEETFEEMRKITGDVPIVLSSGFSEHECTARFGRKGLAGFLQKPYDLASLREKLHKALGDKN